MGLFGAIFYFDNNGTLDAFEETAAFGFFMQMMNDQQQADLTGAGLNPSDLERMGYSERREALEQAGLDPDDYDCD